MHVVIHAPDLPAERDLVHGIGRIDPKIEVTAKPVLAEFRTALYRDPAAIGVLWTRVENYAAITLTDFRKDAVTSPVIVLLHNDDLGDFTPRIRAFTRMLTHGADDVQRAPIDAGELVARLHALARRERPETDAVLLPNDAVYRPAAGKVFFPGGTVWLTGKEAALLDLLTGQPNVVFSREMVMDRLYDGREDPKLTIVSLFICKLRKKLHVALGDLDVIETVSGRGYRFRPEGFTPVFSEHNARLAR